MKSRREYFHSRRMLMMAALICYALTFFLFQVCFMIRNGFATIFVIMSIILLIGIICSIYAHRGKEYLFCPKCGSKKMVQTTLFGIPDSITDICPDCKEKIDLNRPVDKD